MITQWGLRTDQSRIAVTSWYCSLDASNSQCTFPHFDLQFLENSVPRGALMMIALSSHAKSSYVIIEIKENVMFLMLVDMGMQKKKSLYSHHVGCQV